MTALTYAPLCGLEQRLLDHFYRQQGSRMRSAAGGALWVARAGAIVAARIPRVVFGAWDEKVGASGSLYDLLRDGRLGNPIEVIAGVKEAEASEQIKNFFVGRRALDK